MPGCSPPSRSSASAPATRAPRSPRARTPPTGSSSPTCPARTTPRCCSGTRRRRPGSDAASSCWPPTAGPTPTPRCATWPDASTGSSARPHRPRPGHRRAHRVRPARRRRGPARGRRRRLHPRRRPRRRPRARRAPRRARPAPRSRFLGSPEESPDVAERWRGVREGLGAHGIEPTVTPCLFDEASGTRVAAALLAVRDRPDALVCANDEIALGAIVAAEEVGLRVGRDIAITGWDDVMAARHARPALTTVRQPMRALGVPRRRGARRAHHRAPARPRGTSRSPPTWWSATAAACTPDGPRGRPVRGGTTMRRPARSASPRSPSRRSP